MKTRIPTWIIIFLLHTSCEHVKKYDSIEDYKFKDELGSVLKRASLNLKKSECAVFRMDTLTKFDWDRMYAIGGNVLREQIQDQIGIPWEYEGGVGILTEGNLLLVFTKDKKIVSTVKYIEGDTRFEDFSIGVREKWTEKSNSFYYIYKQFDASYPGFDLKVVSIEKDSLIKHTKSIDGFKIISIDN